MVSGASAGVGRATVRAFAAEGASIGLIARDTEGLHAAAREVEQAGGRSLAMSADVADAGHVEAAAERIEAALGPIDGVGQQCDDNGFSRVSPISRPRNSSALRK